MQRNGFTPDRRDVLKGAIGTTIGAMPLAAKAVAITKPDAAAIANAVKKTDALARALLQSSGVPGISVAIVQGDKKLFAAGYGVIDANTGEATNADTVFALASVSKSLASTVVAHQVGANNVGWDT